MANGITTGDNVKRSWLLEKVIAVLQIVILVGVGILYTDLKEVRDGSIKFSTKQERLITDVNNVEYTVRTLNNTVQRLVGQQEAKNH